MIPITIPWLALDTEDHEPNEAKPKKKPECRRGVKRQSRKNACNVSQRSA